MKIHAERFAGIGLLILPIAVAWIFVPQIANAFGIKHHVATIGLFALALLLVGVSKTFAVPKGWVGAALVAWLAAVLGSAIGAENFLLATTQLVEIVALVLLALCLFNLRDLDSAQRSLEAGMMIAAAGVALFALKQYFLPDLLDPGFHALGKMKIYSTLGNSNLAALIILAAVPSAAWRVVRDATPGRVLYATLLVLLAGGLLVTQSRSALIAVGVMGLVALLWLGPVRVRRMTLLALAIVLGMAMVIMLSTNLSPELAHSIKGRWFIWLTTLEMMHDHPLSGVGLGHFGLNHMAYQGKLFATGRFDAYFDNAAVITEGHNEFLNWGAVAGFLGLAGFVMLCAGVLWHGWKSAALKRNCPQLYLALVGYLFAMMFISLLSYPGTVFFFWLLLGMVMARSELPRFEQVPPAWMRYAATAIVGGLLLADGNWAWREVRSGLHEARGDELMVQHDSWLAEKEYQQAIAWDPRNGELHKKYATTLFLDRRLSEALAELGEAKRLSGDLGIYLLEGEVLARHGDLERATADYRQIIAAFPNLVGAHFILGQIYQLQGKQEMAEAEFHKVLDIQPSQFNLNLTSDKVELQKRIVRDYLRELQANPPGPQGRLQ
jgi:O-antigen ligase